jgi:hypothetical protein
MYSRLAHVFVAQRLCAPCDNGPRAYCTLCCTLNIAVKSKYAGHMARSAAQSAARPLWSPKKHFDLGSSQLAALAMAQCAPAATFQRNQLRRNPAGVGQTGGHWGGK